MMSNFRLYILLFILIGSLSYHIKQLHSFASEYKLIVRENYGMRLELNRPLHKIIKTKIIKVPFEKIVYVPVEGQIEIKPKDPKTNIDDLVKITIKNKGLTKKVGFQADILERGYGPDIKLFYWGRMGINTGILVYPSKGQIAPDASLSYKLDRLWLFDNIEAFLGYKFFVLSKHGPLVFGLRINL